MKLIVAAFWVNDDDMDDALNMVVSHPIPGIEGSGAAVALSQEVADTPDVLRYLRRFSLNKTADFEPS